MIKRRLTGIDDCISIAGDCDPVGSIADRSITRFCDDSRLEFPPMRIRFIDENLPVKVLPIPNRKNMDLCIVFRDPLVDRERRVEKTLASSLNKNRKYKECTDRNTY